MGQFFIAFLAVLPFLQGVQGGGASPGDGCTMPSECDPYICDDGRCKIAIGESCVGDEEHCESSAFCEKSDMQSICKIRIGKSCADGEGQCGSSAFCEERDGRKICKAKIEEDCESSCDCPANAECNDDDECKCESGYTASDDNTECSRGSPSMTVPLAMLLGSLVAARLF